MPQTIENVREKAEKQFTFDQIGKDVFSPISLFHARQSPAGFAYGGLVFAQGLAAAERTVQPEYKPNSAKIYFLRAVNVNTPLTIKITRLRDGNSFCLRSVDAFQNDKLCFTMHVSFHKIENSSMVHQCSMPKEVQPENLRSMTESVVWLQRMVEQGKLKLADRMRHRLMVLDRKAYVDQEDLFELRCTNLGNYYGFSSDLQPELSFWMKVKGDLGQCDERLHKWLIACMSDSILIVAAMSPHFSLNFKDSLHVSLDHSLHFHRHDFRADDWLLFECHSTVSHGARTFISGRIWRRDGVMVASCTQEAYIKGEDGCESKL